MITKTLHHFVIIFLIVLICTTGCIKSSDLNFNNLQLTNWTPNWALPLLNAKLTLINMLKPTDIIDTDATGLYNVHYSAKGFTFNASDFIKIPNQSFTTSFGLGASVTSLPSGNTINDSFINHFTYNDSNGAQLAHVNLKAGTLTVNFTSTYSQNLTVNLVFPFITKNGVPLSIVANMNYPVISSNQTTDLTGYSIDMTNAGAARNYLGYNIYFSVTGTGQPISSSNNIAASINMSGLQFSYLDGTLGNYTLPLPEDTVNIGLFNKSINASIYLKNPKFHLNFYNSMGLGVSANIDTFFGVTATGTNINLVIPNINVAQAAAPGITTATLYTIDSTNSTIQNLINPAPNLIYFKGALKINPGSTFNFITDTSKITLNTDVELPAYFKIVSFALQDTVKLTMPGDTNILSYANFAVMVTNAFPLYASIQLFFTDSNYHILDSLVTPNSLLIPQAPVDANGIIIGSTAKASGFGMSQARYHQMASKVRFGLIKGSLYSSASNINTSIQIHTNDSISIKMAFKFGLNVSFVGF